jgi:hypothetical protein
MKTLKHTARFSLVLAAIAALAATAGITVGCKHTDSGERNNMRAGKYTCPMHPEVVTTTPGKCPKCGMDLTQK